MLTHDFAPHSNAMLLLSGLWNERNLMYMYKTASKEKALLSKTRNDVPFTNICALDEPSSDALYLHGTMKGRPEKDIYTH